MKIPSAISRYSALGLMLANLVCGKPAMESKPFHIINLSFPRTGTTSFAKIFDKYPTTHEFMRTESITALLDWRDKKINDAELMRFLRYRDKLAGHFVDSAAFLFLAPEMLIRTFPDSKFFFSIRDCESWMVSLIDQELAVIDEVRKGKGAIDMSYHDRYARIFSPRYDRSIFYDRSAFLKNAEPILNDIATFWSTFVISTLEQMLKLPRKQRLIIQLESFDNSLSKMAAFAGVNISDLNLRQTHFNKDFAAVDIRRQIGAALLTRIAQPHQRKVDAYLALHRSEIGD